MAKFTPDTVTSGYYATLKLNENFERIQTAFENTLSRDGTSPNQMEANLDMNGYTILNANVDVNKDNSLLSVGDAKDLFVSKEGDSMSGNLDMNGYKVLNVPTPIGPTDLVRLQDISGDGTVDITGLVAEENIQGLRDRAMDAHVVSDVVYVKAHTTAGDGGHGVFRYVSGEAPATYTDNNGTIIVPTGGDGGAAWLRVYSGAVNVRWFGAVPGADMSAIAQAILDDGHDLYIPGSADAWVLASGVAYKFNSQSIYGDGESTRIKVTISDGTAAISADGIAYGGIGGFRLDTFLSNSGNPANGINAIGIQGVNVCYGWRLIGPIHIQGMIVGIDWEGFSFDGGFPLWLRGCGLGLKANAMNASRLTLRIENCYQDYDIDSSHGIELNVLTENGLTFDAADVTAPEIDGCHGVTITNIYTEQTGGGSLRPHPYLKVGFNTAVKNFKILAGKVSIPATGIPAIYLDDVNGVDISMSAIVSDGRDPIKTTANTKNISNLSVIVDLAWVQDNSLQLGPAVNYFPNPNFDHWFGGWDFVELIGINAFQETTTVRRGPNALKMYCTAEETTSNIIFGFSDTASGLPALLAGKTLRAAAWVYIPDITFYDESEASRGLVDIRVSYRQSATHYFSDTVHTSASKGGWHLVISEPLTLGSAPDRLYVYVYANRGGKAAAGTEYVVVDSVFLFEGSEDSITNGRLVQSGVTPAQIIGSNAVMYSAAAPTNTITMYKPGDKVINISPSADASGMILAEWVCTTGGQPGTWAAQYVSTVSPAT